MPRTPRMRISDARVRMTDDGAHRRCVRCCCDRACLSVPVHADLGKKVFETISITLVNALQSPVKTSAQRCDCGLWCTGVRRVPQDRHSNSNSLSHTSTDASLNVADHPEKCARLCRPLRTPCTNTQRDAQVPPQAGFDAALALFAKGTTSQRTRSAADSRRVAQVEVVRKLLSEVRTQIRLSD
jgi:hypothetical protein